MVKIDSTQQAIDEITEIGLENVKLTPNVQNWCKHLQIEASFVGMVAQMKRLPNRIKLSCPNAATPHEWLRIKHVAEEFIEHNCLDCTYHSPIKEPNFGQDFINKLKERTEEKAKTEKAKEELSKKIKHETEDIISEGSTTANSTQLSILRLLSDLTNETKRKDTATKLHAAAQLDPAFFNDTALDVLFMYFEDEQVGRDCILAACSVMSHRKHFPVKASEIAKKQISTSPHFDQLARVLSFFITHDNINQYLETLNKLIDRLWYNRFIGEPLRPERDFKNSENLFIYLWSIAPNDVKKILSTHLAINEKDKRININLLLQALSERAPELLSNFTKQIIHSLEYTDDGYLLSADAVTLDTLVIIIKSSPSSPLKTIKEEKAKLSSEAQAVLNSLNTRLIKDRAFTDHNTSITKSIVQELIDYVFNDNIDDKTNTDAISELSYLVQERPELFQSYFDAFLGYLTKVADKEKTFKYYRDELENKSPQEYTTFNFLVGKDYWEVKEIEQLIKSRFNRIKNIIGTLCEIEPEQNLPKVYTLIPKVDSKQNESYKLELLSIVTSYSRDPATIATFIPQLYQHLLDPESIYIRHAALKFLDILFDKFPMLITTSLWDLFEVFINDKDTLIRGIALKILGTITQNNPEHISIEHINIFKESLLHKKVYIHSNAIYIARDLHKFMTVEQRNNTMLSLFRLAEVYKDLDDDDDLFSTIINQLIYYVSDHPQAIGKIAENYLAPKVVRLDYYQAKNKLKRLKWLTKDNPIVGEIWLSSAISFLIRFPNSIGAQDERLDIFYNMHHLSSDTIYKQQSKFKELVTLEQPAMQAHLDISNTFAILGYFENYKLIEELAVELKSIYPQIEANKYLRRTIDYWSYLAASELASSKSDKFNHLKAAENVFKQE